MRVNYTTCDNCKKRLERDCEYVTWRHLPTKEAEDIKRFEFCNLTCLVEYFSKLSS